MARPAERQYVVLKAIHIKKLKGLNDCTITIDGPLTAIMGVNGIGKSTIIHALSCCFRKVDDYGEERKFSSFFPPSPNSNWKNSSFELEYDIVNERGEVIQQIFKEYKKNSDRWAPRYSKQQKKNIKFIGIDTCTPDIERLRYQRYEFKSTERTDEKARSIIKQAGIILNKDYMTLTQNKFERRELMGVVAGQRGKTIKYSSLSMGAGEQRIFRILEAVNEAPIYSKILIDEIDLLLHAESLKRLIKYIYSIADERKLQVIFTSHSLVLDSLKQFVKIKYIDWHPDRVDVYDGITSIGWELLSGDRRKPISIFVEDDFSKTIIKRIARDLNILQKVSVGVFGAAPNAFVLASSFIMQGEDIKNVLIVLDGDVYRTEEEKRTQIKSKYSGNEPWAHEKREKALSLISQYNLPAGYSPEQFLHGLLCSLEGPEDEIVSAAKRMYAVSNTHDWINQIARQIDDGTETIMAEIVEECSKTAGWNEYVKPVRDWLIDRENL